MKKFVRKVASISVVFCLVCIMLTGVSAASTKITTTATGYTSASDVEYVIVSGTVVNWGARNEDCVFLSTYALEYYTGSYTYDTFAALDGGTSQSSAPSSALYSALQSMMQAMHTNIQTYQATRQYYQYTDCVSNNYAKISAFYSGTLVNSTWDGGVTYNRELICTDSKCFDPARSTYDFSDIMTLRATTPSENGSRGNTAYGESSGYFDPGISVRGDCARMLLYTYVRWGNTSKMWGTSGVIENLDVLLRWMEEDPVDTWEMGRNDAVQSITGVRNVFVDYPELAWLLFGEEVPEDMVTPSGEAASGSSGGSSSGGTTTCSHTHTTIRNATEATCTTDGYTGDTYCADCGVKLSSGTTISKTGHKGVTVNQKNATCGTDGYTGDTVCKYCGTKLYSGIVLEATGAHTYGEWVVTVEATDSTPGSQEHTCTVCGATETQEIPALSSSGTAETTAPAETAEPEETLSPSEATEATEADQTSPAQSETDMPETDPAETEDSDAATEAGQTLSPTESGDNSATAISGITSIVLVCAAVLAGAAIVIIILVRKKRSESEQQ